MVCVCEECKTMRLDFDDKSNQMGAITQLSVAGRTERENNLCQFVLLLLSKRKEKKSLQLQK